MRDELFFPTSLGVSKDGNLPAPPSQGQAMRSHGLISVLIAEISYRTLEARFRAKKPAQ